MVLAIQNNNTTFHGKLVRNKILEQRINEVTDSGKLYKMYEALNQIDAKKDLIKYKYIEETIEEESVSFEPVENTYAYITNWTGEKLKEMLICSKSIYSDGSINFCSPTSISDFICDFAKEYYPRKNDTAEKIRKNIFEILG